MPDLRQSSSDRPISRVGQTCIAIWVVLASVVIARVVGSSVVADTFTFAQASAGAAEGARDFKRS